MSPWRRRGSRGASLAETLVALGLLGLLVASAVAGARGALAPEGDLVAARRVVSELRLLRAQAVAGGRARGLALERSGTDTWAVAIYEDGDGDGMRADDIRRGRDPLVERDASFEHRYGPTRPGFLPQLTELRSPPPTSERLEDLDDPVRFGRSDVVTCAPTGSLSSGTLYLTDGIERQLAVVVFGPTGRMRVWDYDLGAARWTKRP